MNCRICRSQTDELNDLCQSCKIIANDTDRRIKTIINQGARIQELETTMQDFSNELNRPYLDPLDLLKFAWKFDEKFKQLLNRV